MRIEHVALYVNDLEAARDFFVRYLDARVSAESPYENHTTGFRSYFLEVGDGARLEVMSKPGVGGESKGPERIGYAHVAFSLGSAEAVDTLTARLAADGYEVVSGPRTTGDGYYESCVIGPEGIRLELTA
jgi:lactoylglutathione lyase